MAKVKIISNPYKQEITYEEWDRVSNTWKNINADEHANSKLISDELKKGFFPFKVNKIIKQIIDEYFVNDCVKVYFEGTEDEFEELYSLCKSEKYIGKIEVIQGDKFLENARDILPNIREIYKDHVYPLVTLTVSDLNKVKNELEKFSDASNDIIPICVLGNYSAGKSTFINSLIGNEILPSAERPTTAKIYKLMQSEQMDRAYIRFKYDDMDAELNFTAKDYKLYAQKSDLVDSLTEALESSSSENIYEKMKIVLELINDYERESEESHIHDLIEIKVPFKPSVWTQSLNKFVVFDTPGSNSASNEKHLQVLKKAMSGMTNGIPVFVTKFDQLDTTDNEKLYEEINSMKELDTRFTMIIVNKADASSLPKDGFDERDKKDILNQAVPKKMFSSGVFFLSSVMGLGAKNNGNFIDDHSAEIFEDQKIKYSDPESRFYKKLYQYNIMPEQLKEKSTKEAENSCDLILANSGLYSVEQEIQTFASKYASYNKCEQSKLFLGQIIDITTEEIRTAKERREKIKQDRINELEEGKKILVEKIEQKGDSLREDFIDGYSNSLDEVVNSSIFQYTDEAMNEWDKTFSDKYKKEMGYDKEVQDIKAAAESIHSGLKESVDSFVKDLSMDSFKNIGKGLVETVKDTVEEIDGWNTTRINVERAAGEALLKDVEIDFDKHFNKSKEEVESASKVYWENAVKIIKQELVSLIGASSELTEEKRSELSTIVIEYKDIEFEKRVHDMFDKARFQRKFWLFGGTGKLYLGKVTKTYNNGMNQEIEVMYEHLHNDHESGFKKWLELLLNTVIENIVDYSPTLHSKSILIKEETERIEELEMRQEQLNGYSTEIKAMMDWKLQ